MKFNKSEYILRINKPWRSLFFLHLFRARTFVLILIGLVACNLAMKTSLSFTTNQLLPSTNNLLEEQTTYFHSLIFLSVLFSPFFFFFSKKRSKSRHGCSRVSIDRVSCTSPLIITGNWPRQAAGVCYDSRVSGVRRGDQQTARCLHPHRLSWTQQL